MKSNKKKSKIKKEGKKDTDKKREIKEKNRQI